MTEDLLNEWGMSHTLKEVCAALDAVGIPNAPVNSVREVAEDSALYWTKEPGNLANVIDRADHVADEEILKLGKLAKEQIQSRYSWNDICSRYADVFSV